MPSDFYLGCSKNFSDGFDVRDVGELAFRNLMLLLQLEILALSKSKTGVSKFYEILDLTSRLYLFEIGDPSLEFPYEVVYLCSVNLIVSANPNVPLPKTGVLFEIFCFCVCYCFRVTLSVFFT